MPGQRQRIEIDKYSKDFKEFHKILDGNYLPEQLEKWGYVQKTCKQFKRGSSRYDCTWTLTDKGKRELQRRSR